MAANDSNPTSSTSTPSNSGGRDVAPPHRYSAAYAGGLEERWQNAWEEAGANRIGNPGDKGFNAEKPKFYCLDMFPYPSGAGLHVGHPEGYTATDIISRYKRMTGHNVLHPMGWDAFGLPAEQYAIQTGVHPAETTKKAIDNFRRQLKRFGFSYDWSREVATIDPGYYRWTQWIFLQIYNAWYDKWQDKARPIGELVEGLVSGAYAVGIDDELVIAQGGTIAPAVTGVRGGVRSWGELDAAERRRFIDAQRLAYVGEQTVNWCPKLGTALANEEVIDGRSERGGYPVFRKPLRQWMFRITAFAERLLKDLALVDWPESTRAMQTEWIGKSEGAEIEFEVLFPALGSPTLRVGTEPTTTATIGSGSELLRAIDNDPNIAIHPVGFVARDPFPPGIMGADPKSVWTRRNLPHIRMPDATYFISWKSFGDVELSESERTLVLDALRHFDGQRCRVYAACVMSNHVHWLVRPYEGQDVVELCESVKRYAATQVNKARGATGRIWDPEAFDHIVRDRADFAEYVAYTVRNPKEAGMVRDVAAYRWTFVHSEVAGITPHSESGGTPEGTLTVFTTRPDTLFGATYMVVAPEHPMVAEAIRRGGPRELAAYVEAARNRSDLERQEAKEKTGVDTGLKAVNPATGETIPVWTADYVLIGYGTGAIMAVPAHDERDFEFATKFGLPVRNVVAFIAHNTPKSAIPQLVAHAALIADDPRYGAVGFWDKKQLGDGPRRDLAGVDQYIRRQCDVLEDTEGALYFAVRAASGGRDLHFGVTEFFQQMGFAHYIAFEGGRKALSSDGFAIKSRNDSIALDGMSTTDAKKTMIAWLEQRGLGRRRINYKLRDWLFSRQRYWGEPFPIVYDSNGFHYPVSDKALPVELPPLTDYQPEESDEPRPLLAKAQDWVSTTAGAAGVDPALLDPSVRVARETNTMPGWAGSCWYYLRYCDPMNAERFIGPRAEKYWLGGGGVDLYIGGAEHAVLHLLYARFWHKALYDLGHVSTPEPFRKLFHQGMITSYAYQREDKSLVAIDAVREVGEPGSGSFIEIANGAPVKMITAKMSKSLKNVINPDDVIREYGADTFRLYEMYMGPLDAGKPWNPRDITGLFRFLQRAWRVCVDEESGAVKAAAAADDGLERSLHRLIAKVGPDIERLSFNTAIAAMIEFVNAATSADKGQGSLTGSQIERFALVLAPFAPHMAEELWMKLGAAGGREGFIMHAAWPAFDPAMLVDSVVEVPVQVAGKVRARISVAPDADAKAVEAAALADPKVQEHIAGKPVRKVIVIPGKMVNIVV